MMAGIPVIAVGMNGPPRIVTPLLLWLQVSAIRQVPLPSRRRSGPKPDRSLACSLRDDDGSALRGCVGGPRREELALPDLLDEHFYLPWYVVSGDLEGLAVAQRLDAGWQVGLARHACPVDQHGTTSVLSFRSPSSISCRTQSPGWSSRRSSVFASRALSQ